MFQKLCADARRHPIFTRTLRGGAHFMIALWSFNHIGKTFVTVVCDFDFFLCQKKHTPKTTQNNLKHVPAGNAGAHLLIALTFITVVCDFDFFPCQKTQTAKTAHSMFMLAHSSFPQLCLFLYVSFCFGVLDWSVWPCETHRTGLGRPSKSTLLCSG